jgi:hypothetical protein
MAPLRDRESREQQLASGFVKLANRAAAIAASPHAGRAAKVVRVLNIVSTVRGALTTVLLGASAIGGAVTVNTVRQDIANDSTPSPRVTQTPRSAAPTATPLTASGLRADIQKRLDTTLAADLQAVDELRKVAVISGARLDQLVAETKQRLQARYEQGTAQLATLIEGPNAAPPSAAPTTSPSVTGAYALLQVITGDLNQIVVQATRAATEPTPLPRPPTPSPAPPTPSPAPPTATPVPTRTPTPSPIASRTPTPTPRPTPTH